MSNVLIGIIGVILFIGLALAGALILGDDFKSSSNDTKAAAAVSQISQLSSAVMMRNMKTGTIHSAESVTTASALIPRFLKSAPMNPVTKTSNAQLATVAGAATGGPATTSIMLLGSGTDAVARQVCESIQRQSGQITPVASFDATVRSIALASLPATNTGCVWNGTSYYAYSKI